MTKKILRRALHAIPILNFIQISKFLQKKVLTSNFDFFSKLIGNTIQGIVYCVVRRTKVEYLTYINHKNINKQTITKLRTKVKNSNFDQTIFFN